MKKTPEIEIIQQDNKNNFSEIFRKKTNVFYGSIFFIIISIVFLGNSNLNKESQVNSIAKLESTSVLASGEDNTVVDDITETNVVANLAESANLAIAPNAASLSVSVAVVQDSKIQATGEIEKPKVLEVPSENREIIIHKTQGEETIQSIADKYGITAQTVKWVNAIKGDKVDSGKELKIIPVDGIVYAADSDSNVAEIAKKYQASEERIISYNNLSSGLISKGAQIVIPGGILPEKERPDYVAPVRHARRTSTLSAGVSSSYSGSNNSQVISNRSTLKAGNAYAFGNCTWYVYNLRPDIGSFWGNASSWAASARSAGYKVDNVPAVGAIAQWRPYAYGMSGYGHVAYVESVNSDGTITISEMNVQGFNVVSRRTVPATDVSSYIH